MTCNEWYWTGVIIGVLATPLIKFLGFLLVCIFGKKYCIRIIREYCGMKVDYHYGFRAWNKNVAIIKALNDYKTVRDIDEIVKIECNKVD